MCFIFHYAKPKPSTTHAAHLGPITVYDPWAGLDLDCGSFLGEHTQGAITGGLLTEADINKAITNNFAVLMRLGFFDGDPSKLAYGGLGPKDVCTADNQELAREAARQGIVLLKNNKGSLPLNPKSIKSLAVIGPNANVTKTMIGNYEGIYIHTLYIQT